MSWILLKVPQIICLVDVINLTLKDTLNLIIYYRASTGLQSRKRPEIEELINEIGRSLADFRPPEQVQGHNNPIQV